MRVAVIAMILAALTAATGRTAASAAAQAPVMAGLTLAAGPGELTVEATPTEVSLANSSIAVRVANTGGCSVSSIKIELVAPPGVTVMVEPPTIARLAAGASMLATITVQGLPGDSPAALTIRVTGHTQAEETAAATSVQIVPPAPVASLSLVGNTRLTDASPADLVAVVANLADAPIDVSVRATAGAQVVRLAKAGKDVTKSAPGTPLAMTVPARQSAVVVVQVQAHGALRSGTVGLVVIAAIRTDDSRESSDITASRQLDVALAGDVLPGITGTGSVLAIPGLVAVWAVLTVWYLDRRRLGLAVPSAGRQIWDNKLWLLAAGAVSLLAAVVYWWAGFADLLDAYTLGDIAIVTVAAGLLGFVISAVAVWWHRRRVPAITPASTELSVLKAANRKGARGIKRQVYRTADGKRGLFVHKDWGAIILTPPVGYTEVDNREAEEKDSLEDAVANISGREDRIHFVRKDEDDYVEGPCAVTGATATGWEKILRYEDDS